MSITSSPHACRSRARRPFAPWLVSMTALSLLALAATGCATAHPSRANLLASLRAAMREPVDSADRSRGHSRTVHDVVESDVLQNMTREQVAGAIGAGDPCSRHPRCGKLGFHANDWFYSVGTAGGHAIPELIVGFDSSGHVVRTWYLKTQ